MAERADLVILGGGLAGLSLAERLARRGAGGRVVVVEPRERYVDDRSWAFWTPPHSRLAESATARWTQWRFGVRGGAHVIAAAPGWCYALVRSAAFYDAALDAIEGSPNVTLLRGARAGSIDRGDEGLRVQTSAGTFLARHVVDTRPPAAARVAASTLQQSFLGREIALDAATDGAVAEVMGDMRCDAKGFAFAYVLPLSPRRVLVEITRFARGAHGPASLAGDLEALLAARGWASARVCREEHAVLPMGLPEDTGAAHVAGVVRAGTAAGALRAASGYGFLRIQRWAERCTDAIAAGRAPLGHPPEPALRRWMDGVFLRALAAEPERAPEFFLKLAARVPGAALVRFLSDEARPADLLRVIAALPPAPFLRALPTRAAACSVAP